MDYIWGKFNLKKHSDAGTKGEDIEIRWARTESIRTLAEMPNKIMDFSTSHLSRRHNIDSKKYVVVLVIYTNQKDSYDVQYHPPHVGQA